MNSGQGPQDGIEERAGGEIQAIRRQQIQAIEAIVADSRCGDVTFRVLASELGSESHPKGAVIMSAWDQGTDDPVAGTRELKMRHRVVEPASLAGRREVLELLQELALELSRHKVEEEFTYKDVPAWTADRR